MPTCTAAESRTALRRQRLGSTSSSRFGSGRFKNRFGSPVALEIVASVDGRSERGTGPVACSSRARRVTSDQPTQLGTAALRFTPLPMVSTCTAEGRPTSRRCPRCGSPASRTTGRTESGVEGQSRRVGSVTGEGDREDPTLATMRRAGSPQDGQSETASSEPVSTSLILPTVWRTMAPSAIASSVSSVPPCGTSNWKRSA